MEKEIEIATKIWSTEHIINWIIDKSPKTYIGGVVVNRFCPHEGVARAILEARLPYERGWQEEVTYSLHSGSEI